MGSFEFRIGAYFWELLAYKLQVESPDGQILGAYTVGSTTFNGNEVGPEGLLEVISPATFQNDLRVMPEGTLSVEGTTTLMGPTNILGPISFGDEFQVSGTAQMDQLFVEGSLNVMGPVSFENGFQVESNGPNGPMLGAYSEGSTTPNGNIAGPEGLLEVASPALFRNELHVMESLSSWKAHFLELQADNLQVESPDGQILGAYTVGSTTFNGDEVGPEGLLEVISPATFQNNLDLTGPEGRLNVEGTTTLMGPTNILGPISFGDEFEIGGMAKMNQLRVDGPTDFQGPAFFQNGLEVVGTNAPILITHREGSSTFDGNEVGPEGLLEVISPATFQNELRVTGIESKLSVEGSAYLMGQTDFIGPARFLGEAIFENELKVTGPESRLKVEGLTELMGPTEFMGPAFFQNGLEVVGTNAPILITHREGSSTFDGNEVGPEGLLEVISPASFQNELSVTGLESKLSVEGSAYLMGQTEFMGPAFFQNGLEVAGTNAPILITHREGSSTFDGNEVGPEGLLEVISPATFQNNLDVTGPEGRLNVEGTTTLMGPTNILGPISFGDEFEIGGMAKMNQLRVDGPTDFQGPAFFQNGLEVVGTNAPILITHREGSSTFDGNEVGPEGLLEVISPATFQNELRVMGPLRSDYLDVMGPSSLGELYVNGSTRLGNSPDGPLFGLYPEGISHNGNEVGPEGLLEVASPATFQSNLEVMGSTTFKGLTTFEGSTTLTLAPDEQFSVSGITELNELRVMGSASIDYLDVMGQLDTNGSTRLAYGPNGPLLGAYREGSTTHNGEPVGPEGLLEVASPATFQNELRVMGSASIDYLDVMGPSSLNELDTNGSTRLAWGPNGPLLGAYREGSMHHNGEPVGPEGLLEVSSPAIFQNNLEVMGSTTFKGLTTFEGSTTLTLAPDEQFSVSGITELNELRVMGSASIDYLDVMGPSSLNELDTNGSTRLAYGPNGPLLGAYREGSTTHNGEPVGPEGLLEVASPATFQNELRVMGSASIDYLDVMGPSSLNELDTNGSTRLAWGPNGPLLGAYREGSMHHNGEPVGPEGLLEVSSPAIFQNNLEVMGSTTFKGLTTFEGSTTLTLAPDEQFSVSGITELNELRVMGSASIDYLDVMGQLDTNGSTRLAYGPNGPLLGAYREGSTTHNGEPVGPEGLLEVASPATFQNELRVMGSASIDYLDVMGPSSLNELDTNGSTRLAWGPNGPLLGAYREGSMHHNGEPVGPEGLLEVSSPAIFQNNLEVMGSTTFKGLTTFEGSTTLTLAPDEQFSVSGITELNELRVMGSASIDYLDVMGPSSLNELDTNGSTRLAYGPNGPLLGAYREGSTTHNGEPVGPEGLLEVASPATFQNELRVMGSASIDYLDVMGPSSLNELDTNGSTRLAWGPNGPLLGAYREGSMHHNGEPVGPEGLLEVSSPAIFQNNLEVMGSTTFKGLTTFEGSTTLTLAPDEQFSVSGITELNELRVMGSASIDYLDVMGPSSLNELDTNGSTRLAYGPNGPLLGAYREGSTTHNGEPVGPEGLLEVASPATFQNELRVMGPTVIETELRVMGPSMLMGPTSIDYLDVMGSSNLGSLYVNQDATFAQNVNVANTLTTMEFALSSDKRLKKDISPTKYDLNSVLNLNPVDYKLKSNNKDQTGFIAQEVKDVIPELVNGVEGDLEKGETLSINYIGLIPVLTKAIQEQQSQIDNQAATIDALLERIIALEKSNNP